MSRISSVPLLCFVAVRHRERHFWHQQNEQHAANSIYWRLHAIAREEAYLRHVAVTILRHAGAVRRDVVCDKNVHEIESL